MEFSQIFKTILYPAIKETLYMSLTSTAFAFIIGFILAIVLYNTSADGLRPNKFIYSILDFTINVLRSFPFIILIIVLFPLTKLLVGTKIGTTAAIVPLTIGTAPFIARLIENSMKEVNKGIIEASKSFGASNAQIIFKVVLNEALPGIINAITLTLIVVIGFSAMAGTIGGGGIGDVAIRYGYQRSRPDIMIYTVIILIAMVQIFQLIGNLLYKLTKK